MEIIVDAQIRLVANEEAHAPELFRVISLNREHLGAWLPWVPHMDSVEKLQAFLKGALQRESNGTEAGFVLFYEGRVTGRIGLYYIDERNGVGSIGYWIDKSCEGKGIVLRACKAIVTHGFEKLGLNRIEIRCAIGNTRSRSLPERLGFTLEGILREAERAADGYRDLYCYSMLRREWNEI